MVSWIVYPEKVVRVDWTWRARLWLPEGNKLHRSVGQASKERSLASQRPQNQITLGYSDKEGGKGKKMQVNE